MISAAILYTGPLPAKPLQAFSCLNCATITRKMFFQHQKAFLQPTINNIWEKEQEALINQLQVKNKAWCLQMIVELIVQDTVPSTGHTQLLQGYGFDADLGMVITLCA